MLRSGAADRADSGEFSIGTVPALGEASSTPSRSTAARRAVLNKKPKRSSQPGIMKIKQVLAMAGMALVMSLGASTLLAQNNDDNSKKGDNNNGDQGRKRGGGNFDPAQFQQQRLDRY